MKNWLLISVLFWGLTAFSQTAPTVKFENFPMGASYRWVYSELNKKTGAWEPYLVEKYEVVKVEGTQLTIEMSSSSYPAVDSEPHHKFILDFDKCEKAAADPQQRTFTIQFYTKSFGNGWQPVSMIHKNLVFTEKFNCWGPLPTERLEYSEAGGLKTFRIQRKPAREASWYYLDNQELSGVAALKLFDPDQNYKFEFLDRSF